MQKSNLIFYRNINIIMTVIDDDYHFTCIYDDRRYTSDNVYFRYERNHKHQV